MWGSSSPFLLTDVNSNQVRGSKQGSGASPLYWLVSGFSILHVSGVHLQSWIVSNVGFFSIIVVIYVWLFFWCLWVELYLCANRYQRQNSSTRAIMIKSTSNWRIIIFVKLPIIFFISWPLLSSHYFVIHRLFIWPMNIVSIHFYFRIFAYTTVCFGFVCNTSGELARNQTRGGWAGWI